MKKITLTISRLALLLALTSPAPAAVLNWTNQAGGSWEAAGNWNPNTTPNATNRLTITSGNYTVLINDATANNDPGGAASWMAANGGSLLALTLGAASTSPTVLVNYTNTTKTLLITATSGDLLSMLGNSSLLISNGTVEAYANAGGGVLIGNAGGASPTLGMYGAGAIFRTTNSVLVGAVASSTGTLNVAAGSFSANSVSVGAGPLAAGAGHGRGVGTWYLRGNSTNVVNTVTVGVSSGSVGQVYIQDNAVATFGNLAMGSAATLGQGFSTSYVYVAGGSLSVTGIAANVFSPKVSSYSLLSVSNTGTANFSAAVEVGGAAAALGEIQILGGGALTLGGGLSLGTAAGGVGTLNQNGGTVSISGANVSLGSAAGATGNLDVAAGSFSAADVTVGGGTLAAGRGVGTWRARGNSTNVAANVILGSVTNSVGYLYVEDNAVVTFNNLRIGGSTVGTANRGTGFVYATGGSLSVTGTAISVLGGRANSYGFLLVSNNAAVDFRGDVQVGDAAGALGEIQVLGGKLTSGGILTLGSTTTGLATVAGSGILELQSSLVLGGASKLGIVTNANGGTVQFTALNNPTVTVGAGSSFVTTNAAIEFKNASAFLTNVFGKITFQGNNTLSLLNSTNAALGSYTVGSGQNFSTLRLAGTNSLWQSTTFTIGSGGSLIGNGRIGSVNATNSGTIAPGSSPGILSFSSNLTLLSSSLLAMELAGTNAGTYDEILVDGNFARNGTLTVSLLSYTPAAGDAFDLFDFGSISGNFSATNLPTLDSGLAWDFTQFNSQGILAVTALIPEPNSLVTMTVAGLAWAILRRRRSS